MSAASNAPKKNSSSQHTIATQLAGAFSTLSFYPLDVVKMRFMSQDGTKERMHNNTVYRSLSQSIKTIYSEEGVRALYRGAHVAVCGATASWGVYMYLYRETLRIAGDRTEFSARAVASVVASSVASVLSNPIWLIKTRMQLEEFHRAHGKESMRQYATFFGGVRHVLRTNGFRGLWVGSSAQVLLGVPNAFNFPIYDTVKAFRLQQTQRKSLDLYEVCICSTFTRTILMLLSHPLFVIKTRLQDQRSHAGDVKYVSLHQAFLLTLKREGLKGLYRGVVPALAQSVPRSVTNFVVYEIFLRFMP